MSGSKIIEGLKQATAGDFARVTIDGQTWARSEWQPIETAPKDGTDILVMSADLIRVARYDKSKYWEGWFVPIGPETYPGGGFVHNVTHWMPTPARPSRPHRD